MTNTQCTHDLFSCNARVGKLTSVEGGPVTHYTTDIRIFCVQCGQHFEFVGLPVGSSPYRPTASFDGLELRAPITPLGVKPPANLPSAFLQSPEMKQ